MNGKPIHLFVCGLHRSGTTVLSRILQSHEDITGLSGTGVPADEGQHVQSVIPSDRAFGGPGSFCFSPGARLTEDDLSRYRSGVQEVAETWNRFWSDDCPVRLEKSPPNLIRSRFLQAAFHDARFVFIVRHPIFVSLATRKWNPSSMESLVSHWVVGHQLMLKDLPHLERWCVIRYEDLCRAPDPVLAPVWKLAGVEPREVHAGVLEDMNARYLFAYKSTANLDLGKIADGHETVVGKFGYSLVEPLVGERMNDLP